MCSALVRYAGAQCSPSVNYLFNGDVTDDSGLGNNGTTVGAPDLSFNYLEIGSTIDDYVEIPPAALDGATDFTVLMNFRINGANLSGTSPTNTLIAGASSTQEGEFAISYQFDIHAICVALKDDPGMGHYFYTTLEEGAWYCLRVTRSGADVSVFIDGVLVESFTMIPDALDITFLEFGQELDCPDGCFAVNQCLNGDIDNFELFNCATDPQCNTHSTAVNENLLSQELSISPNPSQNLISVQLPSDMPSGEFQIIDCSGKIVLSQNISSPELLQIDISSLAPGIYFGILNYNDKILSGSFIRQ